MPHKPPGLEARHELPVQELPVHELPAGLQVPGQELPGQDAGVEASALWRALAAAGLG